MVDGMIYGMVYGSGFTTFLVILDLVKVVGM